MPILPADIMLLLTQFAPLVSRRTWRHVPILIVGAVRAPGRRMVSSAFRAVGLAQVPTLQSYHRVLNRAVWSSLGTSRIRLRLLVAAVAPSGPLVLGIAETIERRRGKRTRQADRGRRHLPRSGALQSQPLRQGEWLALGLPHAAGAHSLGRAGVGTALPDGARSFRALRRAARPPAQIQHPLGPAADSSGPPLAP